MTTYLSKYYNIFLYYIIVQFLVVNKNNSNTNIFGVHSCTYLRTKDIVEIVFVWVSIKSFEIRV